MASAPSEVHTSSIFMQKGDGRGSPRAQSTSLSDSKENSDTAEVITVKDFFDFMKTAYQVYEHQEGNGNEEFKIDWEQLTKLTVINHVIDQEERHLLYQTSLSGVKPITSKSDSALEEKDSKQKNSEKRYSCSEIEGSLRKSLPLEARVEMLGVWTEANLNCKLNDVINEGILDSILPYLVGYKKSTKTSSVYTPVVNKVSTSIVNDVIKPASFGGFLNEKESKDRLGRRKSSVNAAHERAHQKQESDVEIHVCDEVKGLKKDFRCSQKLLVSKMGYFADVTAGQRLEDMDISVHCDIQIFDWLMRWVKRDSILVSDWPLLDPRNVVPILVSASFLQMEPLLQDCMIYCHAHINDIVKTSTNLSCLSDALLTRLSAMYTNAELEAIHDRKDKILSRLYCKMILSLAEPVPETLRGHYATLATLFKCSKCNKLLGRDIAEQVPCHPVNMRIDRRGNVISAHTKDASWSLNEYIGWVYSELRSWRRVYWRLWADCHFLKCQLCGNHFPAYQMEWCSHHAEPAHSIALDCRASVPAARHPCCGERAYKFESVSRNTGCQFREHLPDEQLPSDAAVMEIYNQFRDIIAMKPPQLIFPERLTRIVAREPGEDSSGRLQCSEVFWWEGIQLVPPRQTLGLLGKLYSSNNKFNPLAQPGTPPLNAAVPSTQSLSTYSVPASSSGAPPPEKWEKPKLKEDSPRNKQGGSVAGAGAGAGAGPGAGEPLCASSSSDESEQSDASAPSDEDLPPRRRAPVRQQPRSTRSRVVGRQWVASLSARSNQDGQRRYEERCARLMRCALARRVHSATHSAKLPRGGVYARLEAEWRERHGQRTRSVISARTRQPANRSK